MAENNYKKPAEEEIVPEFKTLAILDEGKKSQKAKVTIPPISSVKEAKDWVDENQK